MNIMSRRGQLDNVVTYEHICDTRADMANIDPQYITLGTICLVLKGEVGLEVYMAGSDKQWVDILTAFNSQEEETTPDEGDNGGEG